MKIQMLSGKTKQFFIQIEMFPFHFSMFKASLTDNVILFPYTAPLDIEDC